MKTTLIATVAVTVLTLATSAGAEDSATYCRAIGDYARTIMKGRQNDYPLSKMMDVLERKDGGSKEIRAMARKLILLAYDLPDFSSEKNQQEAIAEFGNQAELACYQGAE